MPDAIVIIFSIIIFITVIIEIFIELIMRKMYEKGYMIKKIAQIADESEETIKDILQVL